MRNRFSKQSLVSGLSGLAVGLGLMMSASQQASAGVNIAVNLTTQRMNVSVDGSHYATWKVSTGRRGYTTPTGRYRIQRMTRMHYSRKYDNAPMPHSIFYHGGFAIHATYATHRLGRVASHGCVRLSPTNAADLYNLVKANGSRSTKIRVFRGKRRTNDWWTKRKINTGKFARKSKNSRRTVKLASNRSHKTSFIFGGLDLD